MSPIPSIKAFTWVTKAHGPSPQLTACRSPTCSLTIATCICCKIVLLFEKMETKMLHFEKLFNIFLEAVSSLSKLHCMCRDGYWSNETPDSIPQTICSSWIVNRRRWTRTFCTSLNVKMVKDSNLILLVSNDFLFMFAYNYTHRLRVYD